MVLLFVGVLDFVLCMPGVGPLRGDPEHVYDTIPGTVRSLGTARSCVRWARLGIYEIQVQGTPTLVLADTKQYETIQAGPDGPQFTGENLVGELALVGWVSADGILAPWRITSSHYKLDVYSTSPLAAGITTGSIGRMLSTDPYWAGSDLAAWVVAGRRSDVRYSALGIAHDLVMLPVWGGSVASLGLIARARLTQKRAERRLGCGQCPRCCYAAGALRRCPECGLPWGNQSSESRDRTPPVASS